MGSRRVKRIMVTNRTILQALTGGGIRDIRMAMDGRLFDFAISSPTFPGLPADANVVGISYEATRNGWWLLVEHPSFPEVDECSLIPEIESAQTVAWIRERFVRESMMPTEDVPVAQPATLADVEARLASKAERERLYAEKYKADGEKMKAIGAMLAPMASIPDDSPDEIWRKARG